MNTPEYDSLAGIYDAWATADPTSLPCKRFYVDLYLQTKGHIVELGVGTGRIAIQAAKQGCSLTGVDHSPRMLALCRRRAEAAGVGRRLKLLAQDVRRFALNRPASLITLPFRSIGHFLTLKDKEHVFRRVFGQLKPNGTFVFDHYVWNEVWARQHDGWPRLMVNKRDRQGGLLVWDTYQYKYAAQQMRCVISIQTLGADGSVTGSWAHPLSFSWVSPRQVRAIATRVGFVCEACFGNFKRDPLGDSSTEQLWILRKPWKT
jgi:SAM-dependent methyltransferase